MAENTSQELGTEPVGKLLFRLSLPTILAQLINALYNLVDRMYIGRIEGVGATALTGVGVTFPIIMLISAFAALIGMGGAPLAAISMGQKDNDKAERILGNCFIGLIGISVILMVFFYLFNEKLLFLFGASTATIGYANDYLSIYLAGTLFVQMALGLNNFINTQGFSKMGMVTVLIGAVLNIILDPILIFGFHMGVKGAAFATIFSQAVSAVWVVYFLLGKKTILKIHVKNFPLDKSVILSVLGLGVSPFIMQATECLINIVFNSTLQRLGGDIAVGAMTILTSIMQFAIMPLTGLTQGAQPILSFNYGAKQYGRVRHGFRLLLICCLVFSFSLWGAVMLFPRAFISIFSTDAVLMEYTVGKLRIFMCCLFVMGAQIACQQTFLALGRAKISLILALLRKIILLIPLVFILSAINGLNGVYQAEPVADVLAATTTFITFMVMRKKLLPKEAQ